MTITGFIHKKSLPRLIDADTKYAVPYVFVKREELAKFYPDDEIVEVTVEIIAKKVHV